MTSPEVPYYDVVGVGAGPANLSLAALFEAAAPHRLALFDAQPAPAWHGGLLYAGVLMQTSWLKDLVSLVDPGHRLSFLNYLVSEKRVYAFLGAQHESIPRLEYVRYLRWASDQMRHLHYGHRIERVSFDSVTGFSLYDSDNRPLARGDHLVLGLGTRPRIPAGMAGLGPELMAVADDLEQRLEALTLPLDEPVAVVGGGQTGAECVLELRRRGFTDIRWLGRRQWFAPLDDSPTANEFYRPAYLKFLHQVPAERKRGMIADQVLTSDGISAGTLRTLFRTNYEDLLRSGRMPITILPGRWMHSAEPHGDGLVLYGDGACGPERHEARFLVLAGGREFAPLPLDPELDELIDRDANGEPVIEEDYSLRWKGDGEHRIFVQNRARFVHGLSDANLSLLAMRSALIINSLLGRTLFDLADDFVGTSWG